MRDRPDVPRFLIDQAMRIGSPVAPACDLALTDREHWRAVSPRPRIILRPNGLPMPCARWCGDQPTSGSPLMQSRSVRAISARTRPRTAVLDGQRQYFDQDVHGPDLGRSYGDFEQHF